MSDKLTPEESMKIFYQKVLSIDPDECQRISGDGNKLEITVKGKMKLSDFIKQNSRVVTIDKVSTKEVHDKAIAASGMPEQMRQRFSPMFLEMFRTWGVVEYEERSIGLWDNLVMYNGLPKLVSPEEFIRDPNAVIDKLWQFPLLSPEKFFADPVVCARNSLYLHRDFLTQHPISEPRESYWNRLKKHFGK